MILLILLIITAFLINLVLPWWGIAITGFVLGFQMKPSSRKAFGVGFLALFLLWSGHALYIHLANDGILSTKIAEMLGVGSPILVILITGIVGGLVSGLAVLSGSLIKDSLNKESKIRAKTYILILSSVFFVSCATHAPMSEVTMFSTNKKYEKAGGVSISGLGADKSGELERQGEASMREYRPSFGFSYFRNFFIYDSVQTNKGAVSLSIGKSTGMDATVQIFRPLYFTAAASMPKNLMASVLFRITDEDWGGVSIGPVIRQQSFNFKEDESYNIYAPVIPDGHENFRLIGIRSSFIFTPQSFSMPWSDSFVLITLEGGRFIDLNDNYLSINVTFGDLIKYRE